MAQRIAARRDHFRRAALDDQVVVVAQQLEMRVADGLHERKALGLRVEDIRLRAAQRLEHDRDAVRCGRLAEPAGGIPQLLERARLGKALRHPAAAAAAEYGDPDPRIAEPRHHAVDVRLHRVRIHRVAGQADLAREQAVRGLRMDGRRPIFRAERGEFLLRHRGERRRAHLHIVKPDFVKPRRFGNRRADAKTHRYNNLFSKDFFPL